MSFALSAGVTGLQAHQKMIDISGNNLANVNTTGYKSSRITFAQMLTETIKKASQPTTTVGGTNPQQMGTGVMISGISPSMAQGNIVNTGNPLDLAVEGEGYFVLNDGSKNIYTRIGTFAVDADSNLVDPGSGYVVQRIGSIGEADGFQTPGDSNVKVPYDVAMPANATSTVRVSGNLSADKTALEASTNVLASNMTFTVGNSSAGATAKLSELDQYTAGTWDAGADITFTGYKPDGTAFASAVPSVDTSMDVNADTTIQSILDFLNTSEGTAAVNEMQTLSSTATGNTFTLSFGGETTGSLNFNATQGEIKTELELLSGIDQVTCGGAANLSLGDITITFEGSLAGQDVALLTVDNSLLVGGTVTPAETTKGRAVQGMLGSEATATFDNGKLKITDTASGYSLSDIKMTFNNSGTGVLEMPAYFEVAAVGGDEVKNVNITVYDSLGGTHVMAGAFVRTPTANTWDMILTSISGDINDITFDNRRIRDIEFEANNGPYKGLNAITGDTSQFTVTFNHDPANPQLITLDMGTRGSFDGLTQFAGHSTAVAREQDGYEAGSFSTVSVNNEGTVIGVFSNGIKKSLATIRVALFQNPSGLESIGGGYFMPSANSGEAVATQAMVGGAGTIHGGALEKSNVNVANEFVNLIQAQNGFQANARTIRVANEILQELTNLIR